MMINFQVPWKETPEVKLLRENLEKRLRKVIYSTEYISDYYIPTFINTYD